MRVMQIGCKNVSVIFKMRQIREKHALTQSLRLIKSTKNNFLNSIMTYHGHQILETKIKE